MTGTGTPTGPDNGLFGTTTFAFPYHYNGAPSPLSGRYAPDFEAPDSIEEVNSFTIIKESYISIDSLNSAYEGGVVFDSGTAFVIGDTIRRIGYDGSTVWESGSGNVFSGGIALGEETVVASTENRLVGYDRESGEEEWIRHGDIPLVVEDDHLFQVSDDTVTKTEVETAETVWETTPQPRETDMDEDESYELHESGGYTSRLIRFTDDLVVAQVQYAGNLDVRYGWVGIDKETGNVVWEGLEYDGRFTEAMVVGEELIAHQSERGAFYGFSLATGEETVGAEFEHSTAQAEEGIGSIASNGEMVFTQNDEAVLAYSLSDGSLAWEALMPSAPSIAIACTDETVYTVVNGEIRQLNAADGESNGQYDTSVGEDIFGLNLVGDHFVTLTDPEDTETDVSVYGPQS